MTGGRFEAVVLAGGLGTRLRPVVSDRPKTMVEVGGRPFLEILLERTARQGVARVTLAVGYLHEQIERHFGRRWKQLEIRYSIEEKPLGTGGAVRKALERAVERDVFVLNGDTFFEVDFPALFRFHHSIGADATLALKPMRGFERYGTVKVKDGRITGFREKKPTAEGCINGGVYLMKRDLLERFSFPEAFSLERDFFERKAGELVLGAYVEDAFFIDIGIPEDCARARRRQW